MEDKEQLIKKYYKMKFISDFLILLYGITFCSFIMAILSLLITYDSNKLLTIHQVSKSLSVIQIVLFICLTIAIDWLNTKETILKLKAGIKEDEQSC